VKRAMHAEHRTARLDESAAPSGSSRLHFSMTLEAEINKQLQLLFATTLPLKLRHSDVTVV